MEKGLITSNQMFSFKSLQYLNYDFYANEIGNMGPCYCLPKRGHI